ncbi:hypothetical protein [Streptomyces sparsogenes]|uniref:hypothetical protein n=1 Tax=Streptomyces sparsogenes TaxID=67365 RepID=UPI0033C30E65
MAYLTAGTVLVGLLGLLNLLLMLGVIRRLREQATPPQEAPVTILPADSEVGTFSAVDTEGNRLTRDDLTEDLLIIFLSPGCSACEDLLPLLVERAQEYGPDRVLAVVVRGTNGKGNLGEYVDRLSPVARRVTVVDFGDALTKAFALAGMPAYAEMASSGRVAKSGRTLPRRKDPVKAHA